jgi:S-DNA-T family DNA segregation ATPase FtsK/SpoIIIE
MSSSSSRRTWNEVIGLILMGGGVLLLLALLSYDPRDLPSWLFYAKYSSTSPVPLNFVGRFGAVMAGLSFFLFGGASFFAAVALVGMGLSCFFGEESPLGIRLGWSLVFVLSWAYFLDFLDHFKFFSSTWKQTLAIPGAGGWFGHALGIAIGKNTMGLVGTIFVFLIAALTSLILATGFHPIKTTKQVLVIMTKALFQLVHHFKNQFLVKKSSPLNTRESVSNSTKKTVSRPNKRPLKEFALEESLEEASNPPPSSNLPLPKIIDASVPAKKPTLAEVMKARPKPSSAMDSETGSLSHVALENYTLPSFDLLETHESNDRQPADPAVLQSVQRVLIDTLAQFGIEAAPGDITKGPTITRYELYPASGVRVDRISNLERDLARATSAERINILAPIPGKDTVGIEIANTTKVTVAIRELFESNAWQSSKAKLPLALGKDVYGNAIIADLAQMPHLLVAGATGSGKSVCINSIITSLIFKHTPETLRFIMIDPKVVEMQIYNKLPHLVTPVVTDPKKVLLALRWVIDEMELRYKIFAKTGVRNISGFNARPQPNKEKKPEPVESILEEVNIDPLLGGDLTAASLLEEEPPTAKAVPYQSSREEEIIIPDFMPFIVVIVDELADLMQTAPADVESAIARITQMARAAGIHMIVATQTPRADVVTGIIKANIPTRIAFQVASKLDSRVILDQNGADRLLGQGDMLYLPPGSAKVLRAQGVLVTDEEIGRVVDFLGAQSSPIFEPSIAAKLSNATMPEEDITEEEEELVTKCLEIIRQEKKASTSMLQRRLRLGYTRAARVVDILEQRGILGPKDGARDREILIDLG